MGEWDETRLGGLSQRQLMIFSAHILDLLEKYDPRKTRDEVEWATSLAEMYREMVEWAGHQPWKY